MKLGKDFWFWIRLIIELLKALLEQLPTSSNTHLTRGHRAFNAVARFLVDDNEDDTRKSTDLKA